MAKLTCFICPKRDYAEHQLSDPCEVCGRPYGFPLIETPSQIRDYRIVRSLGRGYYGVTFLAQHGPLEKECVLKIAPVESYKFFEKDFVKECKLHSMVAEETEHVVPIRAMFDELLTFGDLSISCHVAHLDFIDGDDFDDFMQKPTLLARTAAQIVIDLFGILDELRNKGVFHNDLHRRNLIVQHLKKSFRSDALDGSIRVVAVDLGSIDNLSRSDSESRRLGDLHWIARHIKITAERLLKDPDKTTDLEYRLASVLEEISDRLQADVTNQRVPSTEDYTRIIKDAFQQVASPWRNPLRLTNFHDSYNAQTLDAWYVPHLLVDPDRSWVNRISTPGPQIITGMRGCGKTMLLRALQFHARATQLENETRDDVLTRLKTDRFVGLYASSTRLLERMGEHAEEQRDPYARLYVAYAIESLRAVRHLREIKHDAISPFYVRSIGRAVADFLTGAEDLADVGTDPELERRMLQIDVLLRRGDPKYRLSAHPSAAFPSLAEAVRSCSEIWNSAYVLFLLDDVSTRYLDKKRIEAFFSALLFQNPTSAFKLTSEAQTLELALRSPGQIERARSGRDYIVFDLGAEVYERISRRGEGGKKFVQEILLQRAARYANHPKYTPTQILGDMPLERIARRIASSGDSTRRKRQAYFGLTALTRVCVGDIGDVISLYDSMLKKAEGRVLPILPQIQSECYQDFCSRRLYDLNRRDRWLKDMALSFAEASHELLVKSNKDEEEGKTSRHRLRQYMQIYLKITGGDVERQYERIRDLIDSGVFVFAGGSEGPRTKSANGSPIQQFKMTFRKIYGLSNFVGLADSDRFELGSESLEEWIDDPSEGKRILLRNLGVREEPPDESEVIDIEGASGSLVLGTDTQRMEEAPRQQTLFAEIPVTLRLPKTPKPAIEPRHSPGIEARLPRVVELSGEELTGAGVETVVLALGFEERCPYSAQKLLELSKPKNAVLIQFPIAGRTAEIIKAIEKRGVPYTVVRCSDLFEDSSPEIAGRVLVDVSGLPKAAIFKLVRGQLKSQSRLWLCRTQAQTYYPRENEVAGAIKASENREHDVLLKRLADVSMGEQGPYSIRGLIASDADQSRRRAVCCFASAKYERLLRFLDDRSYDSIEIATPNSKSNRSALARIAAEIGATNFAGALVTDLDTNDVEGVLGFIASRYLHWYVNGGYNFELAMTGSKPEAIACAIASAVLKCAQCWYVSPETFDPNRFSLGVGNSIFYHIEMPAT